MSHEYSPERLEWSQRNDAGLRAKEAVTLDFLVSATYVCNIYGFDIEDIDERVKGKSMVGFRSPFSGLWLPEWQFVKDDEGNADVTPLAIDVWNAWGEHNQGYFVKVMATHQLENVPKIGQRTTYGKAVQLGLNILDSPEVRSVFRTGL